MLYVIGPDEFFRISSKISVSKLHSSILDHFHGGLLSFHRSSLTLLLMR